MADNSIKKTAKIGDKPFSVVGTVTGRINSAAPNKANEPKSSPARPLKRTDKPPLPVTNPPSKGRSASIYINNGSHLDYLTEVQKLHPRASVSSIVTQLLAAFCDAAEGETSNIVRLDNVEIKL